MSDILYSVYQDSDRDEVMTLLAREFSDRDPPAVAVGLSSDEFAVFVGAFCDRALEQSLTIVARSADSDELCGALLTEDFALDMPAGLAQVSDKFEPVFEILGELDDEYRSGRTIVTGQSLHLLLLGVNRGFSGRGVAHQLVARCLANGFEENYRAAVTEATNPTSQHIFRKQGFIDRVSRSYGEQRFAGQYPFKSIAEHGGPILMDREITSGDLLT